MSALQFDPLPVFRALVDHDVRFVVVGGVAGQVWGSPSITRDLDICYDRRADNLPRLVAALRKLEARLRGAPDGLPFILDERTLKLGDTFTFTTIAGDLDCLGIPAGTTGYDELLAKSTEFDIGGMRIRFCSLDDLMRMKRAADRPKDRIDLLILESLRDEIHRRS